MRNAHLVVAASLCIATVAVAQAPDMQDQGSGSGYEMIESLMAQAKAASDGGDAQLATRYASELLAKNTDKSSWNYGNVVYEANEILGLAALKTGDIAAAKRYLIVAGMTPGSPTLHSFGPEMTLAQRLLEKGEKESVLEFLDLVAKFWATPRADEPADSAKLHRQHATMIEGWKREIRAGGKPRLDRFAFPFPAWGYPLSLAIAAVFVLFCKWLGRPSQSR